MEYGEDILIFSYLVPYYYPILYFIIENKIYHVGMFYKTIKIHENFQEMINYKIIKKI